MCQLVIRQHAVGVSLSPVILQNLHAKGIEVISELFAPNDAAIKCGEQRRLECFHKRPGQEAAFYRPENSSPVDRRKIAD